MNLIKIEVKGTGADAANLHAVTMTLNQYLHSRLRYEIAIAVIVAVLFAATGATTEIMENLREGLASDWRGAWAKELSSVFAVVVLVPALAAFVQRPNLSWSNLRWRILWHLPVFLSFSLLHIALFSALRTTMWASVGETYRFGSIGWELSFEIRKDLLVYIGIIASLYSYRFILTRLQGGARFLTSVPATTQPNTYKNQFLVKMLNREYLVRVDEINWISSASNYVLMNCGERSYPMRFTLSGLADVLDPRVFMRVQRTAIVNLSRITSLNQRGELNLELSTGERVPVSRTYLAELKKALVTPVGSPRL